MLVFTEPRQVSSSWPLFKKLFMVTLNDIVISEGLEIRFCLVNREFSGVFSFYTSEAVWATPHTWLKRYEEKTLEEIEMPVGTNYFQLNKEGDHWLMHLWKAPGGEWLAITKPEFVEDSEFPAFSYEYFDGEAKGKGNTIFL